MNVSVNGDINMKLIDFLIENKKRYGLLLLYSSLNEQSVKGLKKAVPELFEVVDAEYYASNVKYLKPDIRGFEEILNKWGLKANEVLFIDDSERNVNAAKTLGIKTLQYGSSEDISTLNSLLSP